MRSNHLHQAIANGHNRFEICHLMSKGAQALHRPGEYIKDSINLALDNISRTPAMPLPKPVL